MTWYWWTHWFWITSVLGLLNGHPLAGLDPTAAVKMRPVPMNRQLSTRGEPLHFPIAVQSDEDDIFDGHSGSITIDDTRLNDEWLQPERPLLKPQITSTRTSSTIAHLVVASSVLPETTPVYTDQHIITARLNTRSNEIGSSTTPRLSGPAIINGTSTQAVPQTNNSSKRPPSSFPPRDAVAPNLIAINATASSHPNATSDHQPPSSPAEDERHNYTNELLVPGAKSADASAEKPQRQSKNLSSAPRATAVLDASSEDNFTAETKNLLTAMSAAVSVSADDVVSERDTDGGPSAGSLNAGAISGICVAVLTGCGVFGAAGVLAYRRRYVNKPQTLSEPDSSGYIDDSTIRENSDEMYSLDNDSFLNSLEAMTIQNYWTENVKHTKL